MVGEIGDDDGLARVAEYTAGGDKLHMAYCFDLLGEAHGRALSARLPAALQRPSWATAGPAGRCPTTTWCARPRAGGGPNPDPRLLRLAAAFQASLRGTVCLYQGEELGLPEAELRYEDLQDPYGITMWPEFKGRDGCRTPMPWSGRRGERWLHGRRPSPGCRWPSRTAHWRWTARPARRTRCSPSSPRLLHWRRDQVALRDGRLTLLPADPQLLAFTREHEQQDLLCVFNFSRPSRHSLALPEAWQLRLACWKAVAWPAPGWTATTCSATPTEVCSCNAP